VYPRSIDLHSAVGLVGVVVALGFLAIGGRWALRHAQSEAPHVLAGLRLSLAGFAAGGVATALTGIVYLSETDCRQGPSSGPAETLCRLARVSTFGLVLGALLYLASLVVWAPWRGPWRLQLFRAVLGLTLLFTVYSHFLNGVG
jgi:hypothetical protein